MNEMKVNNNIPNDVINSKWYTRARGATEESRDKEGPPRGPNRVTPPYAPVA